MPKIIENLEARLMEEARRQIAESGYSAMTIRSVAAACGVGVGTVYNYFSSKEELLARYMLADWQQCMETICKSDTDDAESICRCIYDQLRGYADHHRTLFQDSSAAAAYGAAFGRYHSLLRSQLAGPVHPFCQSDFGAEFVAEALLTWTMAGKTFEEIYGMLCRLF